MLPQGVVDVADRQRVELRCLTSAARPVGEHQITEQRRQRPSVRGDVVEHHHQRVAQGPGTQQPDADGRLVRQVETLCSGGQDQAFQVCGVVILHQQSVADHLRGVGLGHLGGLPVDLGEQGPQTLVPLDQVDQRRMQCVDGQFAVELHREGHVVRRRLRIGAGEEPQAPLRQGQRCRRGVVAVAQRRSLTSVRSHVSGCGKPGEVGDRRMVEDNPHRQFGTQCPVDPADQLGGGQRGTAEFEEVVVCPDLVGRYTEHLGEQRGKGLLGIARHGAALGVGPADHGLREGGAVQFAVGGQRDRVDRCDRSRHLMARQSGLQVALHVVEIHIVVDGDDITRQRGTLPATAHHRHREADVGSCGECGVDLTELDPEPAELDLVVTA